MNAYARTFGSLLLALAAATGCGSPPPAQESKKGAALDRIQGKALVLMESRGATDAALNAGGPSVYLIEDALRYRLFFRAPTEVAAGKVYAAEGVYAQKAIDEIGDADQGKAGYPLLSSCERVVRTAWSGLPFDMVDGNASLLRARVNRYPARPLFLVTRMRPVTVEENKDGAAQAAKEAAANEDNLPEITVTAEKQQEFRIEGPTVQTAPLWAPQGGTVRCKITLDSQGKFAQLETGEQLCEAVPWSQFRYRPQLQRGQPVRVKTEVDVSFEPRK